MPRYTEADIVRLLQALFDEKQDALMVRRAKTGRGTGEDVDVDGLPGWIWVRYDSDQSKVSKVFSEIRNLPEDVPVVIGKPWPNAEHEQVIGINWPLYYQGLTELVLDQFSVPAHGDSHGETGSDRAPIGLRNLEPARARITNPVSLSVYVEQFRFTYGNVVYHWPGNSIDLTANVPGVAGHRYVLVSLNTSTNELEADNGDIVPLAMSPDLVAIPVGNIPIAYVDLENGETTIEDGDIYDARLLWEAVGGVGDHTHSGPGDGGGSLMCVDEIYAEDWPVVMDGASITPYAFYHSIYVSGLYAGGAADLTWIYPDEAYAGDCPQWIVLRPAPFGLYDSYEITIRHGVGNIWLSGKKDIVLDETTDHIMLMYNGTYWCDLCCPGWGFSDDGMRTASSVYLDAGKDVYPEADEYGLFDRGVDLQQDPDEHFNTDFGNLDAWAGVPFVMPSTADFATYPSVVNIHDNVMVGNRAFRFDTVNYASGEAVRCRARLHCGSYCEFAGVRMDDGTDDNYVELGIRTNGLGLGEAEFISRYRVAAGAPVIAVYLTSIIVSPDFFVVFLTRSAGNSGVFRMLKDGVEFSLLATTGGVLAFSITRMGITYEVGSTAFPEYGGFFDWYKAS